MEKNSDSDKELADILLIARKCSITIHVRGTDKHPVVELLNKPPHRSLPRKVVGLKELKYRYEQALSYRYVNNYKF